MKLLAEKTTLVLAGSWNPAIVAPSWIASTVLGYGADKKFEVEIAVALDDFLAPPRLKFDGIALVASTKALIFTLDPKDAAQSEKSVRTAAGILEHLPHTPVSGVGLNFFFEIANPNPNVLARFVNADLVGLVDDEAASVIKQTAEASISTGDHLINAKLIHANNVQFAFNVHFEVNNAKDAATILQRKDFFKVGMAEVVSLAQKIAGTEVETL